MTMTEQQPTEALSRWQPATLPPIYILARPHVRAPYHLVGPDGYTLCNRLAAGRWPQLAEPASLFWFSVQHIHLCRQCRRVAERLEMERQGATP